MVVVVKMKDASGRNQGAPQLEGGACTDMNLRLPFISYVSGLWLHEHLYDRESP